MSLIKGNHAGLGGSGAPGGALGSFYSHTIDNSIRMSDASNSSLQFSAGTPSSTTTWTMSVWMKKYNPSAGQAANEFFSAGTSGSAYSFIGFQSDQNFVMENEQSGTKNKNYDNRVFRDPNAWFHVVIRVNLGESTQDDRLKLYINGELQTSTADGLTMTAWSYINADGVSQNWGGKSGIANGNPGCDFYLADINFCDGQSYAPTQFGETKDGVWIPKNPSVTYGNNGYRLEFKQTGTGGASSSTIGADTSGNDNHFTDSGLAAHDFMPDSPTRNFATMNPLMVGGANTQVHASATYAEGNLQVAGGGFSTSTIGGGFSTIPIPKDKKIYIEVCEINDNAVYWSAGILIQDHVQNSSQLAGNGSVFYYNRSVFINGTETDYGSSAGAGGLGVARLTAGDVLGIAVDGATGKVWFHRNGTYFKSPSTNNSGTTGNPSAGSNEIGTITNTSAINPSGEIFFAINNHQDAADTFVNFGQDSTFAGNKSAGSETDANGEGLFLYAVPTDYVCLHSGNMSDPAIGPTQSSQADDNFNIVLYTGNNTDDTGITGVGFSPDWTWIKRRDGTAGHQLYDTVRGATKRIRSESTDAEATKTDGLKSFDSDGFTLGTLGGSNGNTETFVAWNWKAGGSASSNSDGSITSSVSANTTAGFSIVSYTGTGSNATVGHGLSSAPEMIIVRNRDSASRDWPVGHDGLGGWTNYIQLNLTNAKTTGVSVIWNDTAPTSSVFTVGTNNQLNENTKKQIAYCFHSVEGFSAIGSFIGNGNDNGPFVYTGFRPAWVMTKRVDAAADWHIMDDHRNPINVMDGLLFPSGTYGETSDAAYNRDFLSNGFKIRGSEAYVNASGGTFIYLAFAHSPYKFANAF